MLFTEPRFLLFFCLVLALYWLIPGNRPRKLLLLIGSYIFYAAWDWRFLALIWFSTLVDYQVALQLAREKLEHRRRLLLLVSLCSNLGVLFTFKYCGFFVASAIELANGFGAGLNETTISIVLPVGISFYTFQTLSYTIDVYARRLQPRDSLLDVALFVAFFPQLVAGPIVRARTFLPQLEARRRLALVPVQACLCLFLIGFFKKAAVSDSLAPFIDQVFAEPALYATSAILGAVLLYAAQIYCDFSGYSDMAIATAGLLGYRLPRNFAAPYLACDLSDFWRRWHISLSSWLRDYLYVPLGGNRHGTAITYRNLMLTMVLGGLWHGAGMNFLFWGFLHGLGLIVHKEWRWAMTMMGWRPPDTPPWSWLLRLLGLALTVYWVCLAWVFFRQPDWEEALYMAYVMLSGQAVGTAGLDLAWIPILGILAFLHLIVWRTRLEWRVQRIGPTRFAVGYAACAALVLSLVATDYRPFVYFQF